MDTDAVLKLDDPNAGYNFDVNAFYSNVADCNNGEPDSGLIYTDLTLPKCFFPLHFIRAEGTVCSVDKSTVPQSVLDDLQINDNQGCPIYDYCNSGCINE